METEQEKSAQKDTAVEKLQPTRNNQLSRFAYRKTRSFRENPMPFRNLKKKFLRQEKVGYTKNFSNVNFSHQQLQYRFAKKKE